MPGSPTILNRRRARHRKKRKIITSSSCGGKPVKFDLPLSVVNLDKASVCGDRKTSFSFCQKRKIGIHIYREFRSVGRDSYLGAQYR